MRLFGINNVWGKKKIMGNNFEKRSFGLTFSQFWQFKTLSWVGLMNFKILFFEIPKHKLKSYCFWYWTNFFMELSWIGFFYRKIGKRICFSHCKISKRSIFHTFRLSPNVSLFCVPKLRNVINYCMSKFLYGCLNDFLK